MTDVDEYARIRKKLLVAVRGVCPAWLRDREDDLVQAGMMALMRIAPQRETNREFPASYLRKVAYSALVDEIRRQRSRKETSLETTAGEEMPLPESRPSPERETFGREISAGIRKCLAQLVEPRKLAVTLHLMGYKVPQIARKMGWDAKRASNLVYRGLDGLRECLRGMELTP